MITTRWYSLHRGHKLDAPSLRISFVKSCMMVFCDCNTIQIFRMCSWLYSLLFWVHWTSWAALHVTTLKEKRVLKLYPWGTILKNSAFFGKKGTILPFLKVAPKQCPKRYHFTDDQTVPQGHHFGATYFFECRERIITEETITHSKAVIEKPVDNWINKTIGHGQPMYRVIQSYKKTSYILLKEIHLIW